MRHTRGLGFFPFLCPRAADGKRWPWSSVTSGLPGKRAGSYGPVHTETPVSGGGLYSSDCTEPTAIFSHVYLKCLVLLFTLTSVPDTEERPDAPGSGLSPGIQK